MMIGATMDISYMKNRTINEKLAANYANGLDGRPVPAGGLLSTNVPLGRGVSND